MWHTLIGWKSNPILSHSKKISFFSHNSPASIQNLSLSLHLSSLESSCLLTKPQPSPTSLPPSSLPQHSNTLPPLLLAIRYDPFSVQISHSLAISLYLQSLEEKPLNLWVMLVFFMFVYVCPKTLCCNRPLGCLTRYEFQKNV